MTPEQMQKIVDGAPDGTATHWVETKLGHYYSVEFQSYFRDEDWHDSDYRTEQELVDDYGLDKVLNLADLRTELAKRDLLKLEAIICDGDKISDEARELIKDGFVGSIPTMKTVINSLNKEQSIQVLDLRDVDIPHGTIVLEK